MRKSNKIANKIDNKIFSGVFMKKYNYLSVAVFGLFIFLQSCSPKVFTRMEPLKTDNITWRDGRQISTLTDGSVYVSVNYEKEADEKYYYFVEVMNNTEGNLLVSPESIWYTICNNQNNNLVIAPDFNQRIYSIDPEKQIIKYEKDKRQAEADSKSASVVNAVGSAIAAAAILSSDDKGEDSGYRKAFGVGAVTHNYIAGEAANSDNLRYTQDVINDYQAFWERHTLRKTTLRPGERISGYVVFPKTFELQYMKISVPSLSNSLEFDYKKVTY